MDSSSWFILIAWLVCAGIAATHGVVLTLQTWEHRRFVRSRLRNASDPHPRRRVALLAPCKGWDDELEQNLRPLLQQDHENHEVVFIVESPSDPACDTIRTLITQHPRVDARLVVAGRSTESGQKVHNLRAGTNQLSPEVEVLAFVDADARPRPDWLRRLTQHLEADGAAAVTAYRWFVPRQNTLANHLVYSINSAITPLVAPSKHHMVWGGSWAIRRAAFDATGLYEAWRGTLSDDLVAAKVLGRAKCRIEFEPACMMATLIDSTWGEAVEFVRRQYTVGRFYTPIWWAACVVMLSVTTATLWAGVAATIVGAALGASWTWAVALGSASLYGLNVVRAWLRQDAARTFMPQWRDQLAAARRFDLWFGPLVGAVNWLLLASTLFRSHLTWRGNTYRVYPGGLVRLVGRQESQPNTSRRDAGRDSIPAPHPASVRRGVS